MGLIKGRLKGVIAAGIYRTGDGYGFGSGDGFGFGFGYGDGSGYGDGYGTGDGTGYGFGSGYARPPQEPIKKSWMKFGAEIL